MLGLYRLHFIHARLKISLTEFLHSKKKNMPVPLLHNKWIVLTQNSFGFNFIVSGFLVVYSRVYTSVLHGEVKIYGQILTKACCFLVGKGVMFVHLKRV